MVKGVSVKRMKKFFHQIHFGNSEIISAGITRKQYLFADDSKLPNE
jgi:hypothetical protein